MAHAARSRQRVATIVGKVEFREGEGILLEIRIGEAEVNLTRADATLSWIDGDCRGQAAMPLSDFRRYVSEGAIRFARQQFQPGSLPPVFTLDR